MLYETLRRQRVHIFCGAGGVGKTTVAAAIGYFLTAQGHNVLVMTIDPARRLMDALGMSGDGQDRVDVEVTGVGRSAGKLSVFMLDARKAMDELLAEFVKDEAHYQKIISNSIYQQAAGSLSGSQEYIALGKIYALLKEPYDYIIIDTAPTRYALDFFEAPHRLVRLLDGRIMKFFLTSGDGGWAKWLGNSASAVVERIESAFGLHLFQDISEFLELFQDMFEDFRDRVMDMHDILRDADQTAFHVIGVPIPASLRDIGFLQGELTRLDLPLQLTLLNRIHPKFKATFDDAEPASIHGRVLMRSFETVNAVGSKEQERLDRLLAEASLTQSRFVAGKTLAFVPYLSSDVAQGNLLERLVQSITLSEQSTVGENETSPGAET